MKVSWDDYSILIIWKNKPSMFMFQNHQPDGIFINIPLSTFYPLVSAIYPLFQTNQFSFLWVDTNKFFSQLETASNCFGALTADVSTQCLGGRRRKFFTEDVAYPLVMTNRHSCGKIHQCSSLFKGKSTISMFIHEHPRFLWSFSIAMLNNQRIGSFLCASIIW